MRIFKKKGKSMIGLDPKQNTGMYETGFKVKIPMGTEISGEPLVVIPLSNGTLQISIPNAGGIPRALRMLADCLAVLAEMQNQQNMKAQQEESRIVKPVGVVPNLTTH